jgi:hypothetical protein
MAESTKPSTSAGLNAGSIADVAEARKRLRAIERNHVANARRDPRFKTAMEFVRSYGRLGLAELDRRWTREVERMEEGSGGGD